uniref:Uncharacterized protein n=1 Tax=Helianthus annuus TaxID=4232 RepID=A0A251SXF0_HELAN
MTKLPCCLFSIYIFWWQNCTFCRSFNELALNKLEFNSVTPSRPRVSPVMDVTSSNVYPCCLSLS